MNVLVTGGAGYIGSHTVKALALNHYRPVVIDDLSTGQAHNVKWGPLVRASLSDTAVVRSVLKEYKIESVVHFAGSALLAESVARPLSYFQNNVGGTLSLLEAMLDVGVKDIVFSSTCATYGLPLAVPITEGQPQKPINPYGDSKLVIERVLEWVGQARQVRWVALRYFNAAGADPEGELGEEHEHETHLIPLAIGAALGQRERLQIFGTDYPTPDGTAIRDYIHVTDLASAHICALQYLHRGEESRAINVGTGSGASVLEVIAKVHLVGGKAVPTVAAPRRTGDPPILVASPELARRLLHWEPSHSSLETIIETAWRWHSNSQRQADLQRSISRVSS
ncbi:MAG: UDP-glucose 4-epimerase GalE [Acidobacteria bacterium]|nr:MAG: UDP-glucose 4-epimerase GalE [Acidobacteriota bacterium]